MITFNLGLLRLKMFGCLVKESPPYVADRIRPICDALAETDAHIVALQEIYEKEHVSMLLDAVKAKYPYHARFDNQHVWQFHSGLLFLSQYPITASEVLKHSQSSAGEQILGCKSCLSMQVDTPLGPLCLANLHTTAGGGIDTESAEVDTVRQSELAEAVEVSKKGIRKGCKALIVGDFNCGPQASTGNYEFMSQNGYVDAVLPFANPMITWDCSSPLNNLPIFAKCPSQRIDHFFVHKDAGLVATSAKLIFTEATVQTFDGKMVPLSDHYGVAITFRPS